MSSINHFRPFILNSNHQTSILNYSKPVVQAFEKINKGKYPTSAKMKAFLLAATQNNVSISHIKDTNNLVSDFGSRNKCLLQQQLFGLQVYQRQGVTSSMFCICLQGCSQACCPQAVFVED